MKLNAQIQTGQRMAGKDMSALYQCHSGVGKVMVYGARLRKAFRVGVTKAAAIAICCFISTNDWAGLFRVEQK
jgi:hypothetical protein